MCVLCVCVCVFFFFFSLFVFEFSFFLLFFVLCFSLWCDRFHSFLFVLLHLFLLSSFSSVKSFFVFFCVLFSLLFLCFSFFISSLFPFLCLFCLSLFSRVSSLCGRIWQVRVRRISVELRCCLLSELPALRSAVAAESATKRRRKTWEAVPERETIATTTIATTTTTTTTILITSTAATQTAQAETFRSKSQRQTYLCPLLRFALSRRRTCTLHSRWLPLSTGPSRTEKKCSEKSLSSCLLKDSTTSGEALPSSTRTSCTRSSKKVNTITSRKEIIIKSPQSYIENKGTFFFYMILFRINVVFFLNCIIYCC